ncbi:MAG TPA: hypothetical protein VMT16_09210 [Thermoanaerobaculia bacterium]|nr:hypothetical protein [Thermoanaerobaculia bacterium]
MFELFALLLIGGIALGAALLIGVLLKVVFHVALLPLAMVLWAFKAVLAVAAVALLLTVGLPLLLLAGVLLLPLAAIAALVWGGIALVGCLV